MNLHNKTYTNPFRRGSAKRPTFAQRESAIEAYMDDNPSTPYFKAATIVDELFKDWTEEHA